MGKKRARRRLPDLESESLAVVTVVLDRETERTAFFHPGASKAEAYAALTAAQAAAEEEVVASTWERSDDDEDEDSA